MPLGSVGGPVCAPQPVGERVPPAHGRCTEWHSCLRDYEEIIISWALWSFSPARPAINQPRFVRAARLAMSAKEVALGGVLSVTAHVGSPGLAAVADVVSPGLRCCGTPTFRMHRTSQVVSDCFRLGKLNGGDTTCPSFGNLVVGIHRFSSTSCLER